ncbi:MAG: LamG domain-containing protein, partial [Verrucomicrobiales bacterium]|nr:LamG domain-containing protein [Verrucomicrobiales bacterium]
RLGAFADLLTWNPTKAEVPEENRPLVTAKTKPAFAAGRWTHVVFTWDGFNSGKKSATAKLYIDGNHEGTITGWDQKFTWKPDETSRLLLGLNYIGLLDEVSCFDRSLTLSEIESLHTLKSGLTPLLPE